MQMFGPQQNTSVPALHPKITQQHVMPIRETIADITISPYRLNFFQRCHCFRYPLARDEPFPAKTQIFSCPIIH